MVNKPEKQTVFRGFLMAFALFMLLANIAMVSADDCLSFNPNNVQAKQINGTWKVVDGGHWMMDFGTSQSNAVKAVNIIKFYNMSQMCFVGRPNAPMMYFKVGNAFPQGSYPGQDAIAINPYNVKASLVNGRWKVVDCNMWILDFGTGTTAQANALTAAAIIKNNKLRYQCFVGRPNAPMMYWLADPAYRPSVSLSITNRPQETNNWCWAASGQMCMQYFGVNISQCTQANNRFNRSNCCNIALCPNPNNASACNAGGWPEFTKYGFSSSTTSNTALSWNEVWRQVSCLRKPIAFSWHWAGGGGHMMVIRGARIQADGVTRMVQVNDPWSPCVGSQRWITYEAYVSLAGNYTHWNDYYNITKN